MANIHNDQSFKIALITEDLQGDQSRAGSRRFASRLGRRCVHMT